MNKLILTGLLLCAGITGATLQAQAQQKQPVLNHIAISVYNLEKSTAFYRDVLLIDTMPEPFHDGKHTWFKIGGHSQLHLIEGAKEITEHDRGSHLCFSVPSVDDFIVRLNQRKIPFINWKGEKQQFNVRVDGVKQLYIQDPDGYWIEINDDKY
ncbi:VOC family protein [Chitinophaga japonensis]|uniref:Lactoylglutathione lyase n=1 Tax=Chitinophaga japonensis TaxID=104662 RepID=A0A562T3R8_CHIJA|nr:VOC family protein [Chitinophaga japonensis]TWI87938.1 lactoylglutathione lyase [Chitinophaga japonensis]